MNLLKSVCISLMIGGCMLSGISNGHAQTAEEILNKANAVYSNAKTYHATYRWEEKWDKTEPNKAQKISLSETQLVDTMAIGLTKFRIQGIDVDGHEQVAEPFRTMEIVDDGQQVFVYQMGAKGYTRRPHAEQMRAWAYSEVMDMIMPQLKPQQGFTYSLLAPTTVNGKRAYVIEAKGERAVLTVGPQDSVVSGENVKYFPDAKNVTLYVNDLIYIDQTNFHLLQKKSTTIWPHQTVRFVQVIQSEILDAPMPESDLVFEKHYGAKDLNARPSFPWSNYEGELR